MIILHIFNSIQFNFHSFIHVIFKLKNERKNSNFKIIVIDNTHIIYISDNNQMNEKLCGKHYRFAVIPVSIFLFFWFFLLLLFLLKLIIRYWRNIRDFFLFNIQDNMLELHKQSYISSPLQSSTWWWENYIFNCKKKHQFQFWSIFGIDNSNSNQWWFKSIRLKKKKKKKKQWTSKSKMDRYFFMASFFLSMFFFWLKHWPTTDRYWCEREKIENKNFVFSFLWIIP